MDIVSMDFSLSPEQEAARDAAREFAQKVLEPQAAQWDKEERFPEEGVRGLAEQGLLGLLVPETYGGAGLDAVSASLALMELGRADASTAVTLSVNSLVAEAILRWGDDEQRQRYLPGLTSAEGLGAFALTEPHAGSDAQAIRTRADRRQGGFVLEGEKTWITNASHAGVFLILAVTDPAKRTKGISAFLVERGAKGLTVGKPEPKMGQRASHSCPLVLDGVKVPESQLLGGEGNGLKIALSALDSGRIGIASLSTGIIQACQDAMTRYASERTAFGKPIADFQAIQWMIADTVVDLESARHLSLSAAWHKQAGQPYTDRAAIAKLFASEAANRAAYRAVQVHGGYGYSREFPVERLYRDARVLTLYEGTSEIQRLVIARNALKMGKPAGQ